MKLLNPILSAVASIGIVSLCCQSAHAQLLFSEGFNYTPGGELGGNVNPGSGVAWSGGNSDLAIGSGQSTYAGLQQQTGYDMIVTSPSSGGNSTVNTYSAVTSGSIYYSFLIDCTTLPTDDPCGFS